MNTTSENFLDNAINFINSINELQADYDDSNEKIRELQEENEELRQKIRDIGEKYSKATEYFDPIIENRFVEILPLAKKFVNDIGNEILQIL